MRVNIEVIERDSSDTILEKQERFVGHMLTQKLGSEIKTIDASWEN